MTTAAAARAHHDCWNGSHDWLMDDDQHEAGKREKSRQSHKAGVEVDDNFADETWDESSMEASKS